MFSVVYMLSELRRRSGRTVLTALGLAVGVGLVVTVSALSAGLDRAQAQVLKPLTGVGTDLSVSRPLRIAGSSSTSGAFPGAQLSDKERKQLERENGGARVGLRNLGTPGSHFSRDDFVATGQLSFPAREVRKVAGLDGVKAAAGGLTLTSIHVEGTVPKETGGGGVFAAPGGGPAQAGPRNIDLDSLTVTGVDGRHPELGAVTPGQIARGRYFSASGGRYEAILNLSYARRKNLKLGETFKLGGKTFTVVGLARTPLGGQASDVYVRLSVLQKLSGREGRVNTIYVRADSADRVDAVAREIRSSFSGSSVTTAKQLADRISGSLVDAKNLADRLGTALELVALLAAFLIASLLTLSSVAKRIRELGTLKAIGWPQRLVVGQVTGESLLQGLLGGVLGAVLGVGGAILIEAFAPTLKATVAQAASQAPVVIGPFGQGAVTSGSETVSLGAPVSISLLLLAVGLALVGGLVSGAAGGLRAARLRPADALRHVD